MRLLKLLLFTGITLLLLPLLIAWGMKWEWTGFAPGTPDGWLGFWGGYIGAVIGALTAGAIAYFVATKQIELQTEKDDKREKNFLASQIRIQKLQEVNSDILQFNREHAIINAKIIELIKERITQNEFEQLNDAQQEKITQIIRNLKGNEVFNPFSKEIYELIEMASLCLDKAYEAYHNPLTKKKSYNPEDVSWRAIDAEFNKMFLFSINITEKINERLHNEIKNLTLD
ncbi:hypothetical protein D1B31_02010 [Neobacillus notoginsengisoli]|uniref:Uncharacterized protein n=1 Tax=Neobacillus notoginsengisoli TaxID=1578198 RepID=A0A417Z0I7_9BACI|nr:hypothetical protein [Neobacillus notoginsengisoli]RHW43458.1 hypothetical protein D1B31_02010 [Neobacillus notoginsengisoli]